MISIGLPAIKPDFLAEAIQSVLNQRFPDFELILFNDRSDERIRRVALTFSDARIRYLEGTGPLEVVENWNRVLSFALGDYFVLFADDDRYHPDFLQEMNALIEKHPSCDIFHCRVRKIDAKGNLITLTNVCPAFETGLDFIYHRLKGGREQFAPEFVVRTSKLRSSGGFVDLPLAWGSDDMTWFTLALDGGVSYCPEALADWRQSPFQISETGDVVRRLQAVDQYTLLLRALVDKIQPGGEREMIILQEIRALIIPSSDRQKAHLVAVNARYNSLTEQVRFFFRNRKKYNLKIMWGIYSFYSNITNRFASLK